MTVKSTTNNFFKDSLGNLSMARLATFMAMIMGIFTGVCIPFNLDSTNVDTLFYASVAYFGLAIAGKVTSKLTEKV